ncbi:hypothetical protein N431DRAFT_67901 [Stipitochalara longipes BDJ]|nr:hypothetical protein N431DRAFT_67901 [Stipitochalara longipes BDJ]
MFSPPTNQLTNKPTNPPARFHLLPLPRVSNTQHRSSHPTLDVKKLRNRANCQSYDHLIKTSLPSFDPRLTLSKEPSGTTSLKRTHTPTPRWKPLSPSLPPKRTIVDTRLCDSLSYYESRRSAEGHWLVKRADFSYLSARTSLLTVTYPAIHQHLPPSHLSPTPLLRIQTPQSHFTSKALSQCYKSTTEYFPAAQ